MVHILSKDKLKIEEPNEHESNDSKYNKINNNNENMTESCKSVMLLNQQHSDHCYHHDCNIHSHKKQQNLGNHKRQRVEQRTQKLNTQLLQIKNNIVTKGKRIVAKPKMAINLMNTNANAAIERLRLQLQLRESDG